MSPIIRQTARQQTARTDTRWYRCQVGGDEMLYSDDGEPLGPKFVLDGFNIELPDTDVTRDEIEAASLEFCPDKKLVDFWPLSSPPATEL